MDVLREVDMNNAQIARAGRIEITGTSRDRQSSGEQYQAFRRRTMPTDNLTITFFPVDAPQSTPTRQPNRLSASAVFAFVGTALLLATLLSFLGGLSPLLALVFLFPALFCLFRGRKSVIRLIRMAIHRLLR